MERLQKIKQLNYDFAVLNKALSELKPPALKSRHSELQEKLVVLRHEDSFYERMDSQETNAESIASQRQELEREKEHIEAELERINLKKKKLAQENIMLEFQA